MTVINSTLWHGGPCFSFHPARGLSLGRISVSSLRAFFFLASRFRTNVLCLVSSYPVFCSSLPLLSSFCSLSFSLSHSFLRLFSFRRPFLRATFVFSSDVSLSSREKRRSAPVNVQAEPRGSNEQPEGQQGNHRIVTVYYNIIMYPGRDVSMVERIELGLEMAEQIRSHEVVRDHLIGWGSRVHQFLRLGVTFLPWARSSSPSCPYMPPIDHDDNDVVPTEERRRCLVTKTSNVFSIYRPMRSHPN